MNKNVYDKVVELCNEKGISQRKLQEDLGIANGTISKWKTATPRQDTLQKVADHFNVSIDYLTGRTKYRNREHMLQSFDLKYKPDMTKTDIPVDMCIQTDEGIIIMESMSAAPTYIDSETRELAEKIMNDDQLKRMMKYVEHLSTKKREALYNMIAAMDEE